MRALLLLVAPALLAAAACGSDAEKRAETDVGSAPVSGLRFDGDLARAPLLPGSRVTLALVGPELPEGARLWLDGNYLDASLDRGVADMASGRAEVTLAVPTSPTTFSVRARLGSQTARVDLSVNSTGVSTIRLLPKYRGPRPATLVVASAFSQRSCAEASTDALSRFEGPVGGALEVTVPAARTVAVFARLESYATGCVEVPPVAAGTSTEVSLELYDKPLDLSRAFAVSLTLEATDAAAWEDIIGPARASWLDAFVPAASPEADWLLDEMTAAAADQASGAGALFEAKRQAALFDSKTTSWLAAHAPTVRARTASYLSAATKVPPSPLELDVVSAAVTGQGQATATTLAGLPVSGFVASPSPFNWSADAADVLRLSGVVTVKVGPLVEQAANAAATGASLPKRLATDVDCDGLAQSLVGAGVAYAGCDAACVATLCASAFARRTTAASAKVDVTVTPLSLGITATGTPAVGPKAEVLSFAGTWTGTLQSTKAPLGMRGVVTGTPKP